MLTLPETWSEMVGGALALALYRAAGDENHECARHLVEASLELAVTTYFRRNQPGAVVRVKNPSSWSILGLPYKYVQIFEDLAFEEVCGLSRNRLDLTLILAPSYEMVAWHALRAELGARRPCTWVLQSFISYRTSFAAIDMKW